MKRTALVVTIVFALLAFGVGFAGATATLDITRPVASDSTGTIHFVVHSGDTSNEVADNLAKVGLIRNAFLFRLMARYRHLDGGLKEGTYTLNPGMNMDQIIGALEGAPIKEQQVVFVPPGLRVTQYPQYLSVLPKFNEENFLKIAQTGILLDASQTPLWTKYWFIQKPGKNVKYALEGYLFPDTYNFDKTADENDAIDRMLGALGQHLCPGPDGQPDAYWSDQAQCKAHAAKVGNTDIFAAMEKAYATKDDVLALNKALIFASLTVREIKKTSDAPGVTNVYFTRYMAVLGKTFNAGDIASLGADPTVQYARDSIAPPKDGKWWTPLKGSGNAIAKTDPYNTYIVPGLPPGPIAAPVWEEILAASNPAISKYFYFVQDCHGTTLYATTDAQNRANLAKPCS
jgi:UPF0755 protein